MRYVILTCQAGKEKRVLNPTTGNMLIEKEDGTTTLKHVSKAYIKHCMDDALSGENGWSVSFYDDKEPPYKEKL